MEQFYTLEGEWSTGNLETPFGKSEVGEGSDTSSNAIASSLAPWSEGSMAFAEEEPVYGETEQVIAELFEQLRDETFDEAVSFLAEETELAIVDRVENETPGNAAERERLGQIQLEGVRYEAHEYLENLEKGVAEVDVASFSDEQLEQFLDGFDRQPADLSPAGEEFIGGLIRKAKKAVKWVANKAKKVASFGLKFLGPILKKLKGLINPLLKRVLGFAIGRLPAPLRPAARKLASRIRLEAEDEDSASYEASADLANHGGSLAEQFDAALAESIYSESGPEGFGEDEYDSESSTIYEASSGQLETLSTARGQLLDQIAAAQDEQDLSPQIEQFVPALLGALRIGIRLVGRPKVVKFLAGYLAKLIGRWVGPNLSRPLSNAIVDTGLRLISLEAEAGEGEEPAGREVSADALAGVIEDTVRRFAENEDFVFEDESLMQLAASEAFSAAAATHFPGSLIKGRLQQAPRLGGTFVRRRSRSLRPFARYTRVPEATITSQMADALPAFGGASLGAVLRNAGLTFPVKARLHIYQALVGTSVPQILHRNRAKQGSLGRSAIQPLTRTAAGILFGEPKIGTHFTRPGLMRRERLAPGQRLYFIEVLGQPSNAASSGRERLRQLQAARPSGFRQRIDVAGRAVVLTWYISERRSQQIVAEMRKGAGAAPLLQALARLMGGVTANREAPLGEELANADFEGLDGEEFSLSSVRSWIGGTKARLARKVREWTAPALGKWARDNSEAFLRAVQNPANGVTLTVRLTGVPGLTLLTNPAAVAANPKLLREPLQGKPAVTFALTPGYSG